MKICVCQFVTSLGKIKHVENIIDFDIKSMSKWKEGTLISDGKGNMYRRSELFETMDTLHGWEKHP